MRNYEAEIQSLREQIAGLERERDNQPISKELTDLAELLHDQQCHLAHEDQCTWYYEKEEWQREGHGWAAGMWTDNIRAHSRYLAKARKVRGSLPENIDLDSVKKVIQAIA